MGYCALVVCLVWSSLFRDSRYWIRILYRGVLFGGWGLGGGGGSLSGFGGRFFLGFRCFGAFL